MKYLQLTPTGNSAFNWDTAFGIIGSVVVSIGFLAGVFMAVYGILMVFDQKNSHSNKESESNTKHSTRSVFAGVCWAMAGVILAVVSAVLSVGVRYSDTTTQHIGTENASAFRNAYDVNSEDTVMVGGGDNLKYVIEDARVGIYQFKDTHGGQEVVDYTLTIDGNHRAFLVKAATHEPVVPKITDK